MKINALCILVIAIFIIIFTQYPASAHHDGSNPPYQINKEFRHYIIFVALERDCKMYDKEILEFFKLISSSYLHKYGFNLISTKSECINAKGKVIYDEYSRSYGLKELEKSVARADKWSSNLVIIIFDYTAGVQYNVETLTKKNAKYAGHHIYYLNQDHIVSKSSFGKDGESDFNSMTLSHELSHFALRYLEYPQEIWSGDNSYVHLTQKRYDQCAKNKFSFLDCQSTFTTIKGRTGEYFHVLAPYDKPIAKQEKNTKPKNPTLVYLGIETKNVVMKGLSDGDEFCVVAQILDGNGQPYRGSVRFTSWALDTKWKTLWEDYRYDTKTNSSGYAQFCTEWIDEEPTRVGIKVATTQGNRVYTFNNMVYVFTE